MGDVLGREIAAGAAAVLDDHLLAPDVRQPLTDDAGDGVGAAAGGEGHDQADVAVRPALRDGRTMEDGGASAEAAESLIKWRRLIIGVLPWIDLFSC